MNEFSSLLQKEEYHETIIFEQDCALPHFFQAFRQHLNENFAENCIGRRGHWIFFFDAI